MNKELLEMLKTFASTIGEGLQELKAGNTEQAIKKFAEATEPLNKTIEDGEKAVENGENETDVEKAIKKFAENPDALVAIEKWVNLGISGDKMESVITDVKALVDFLDKAGGVEKIKETVEKTEELNKTLTATLEKSQQLEDEGDDDKGDAVVNKTFRNAFNKAQGRG